MQITLLGTGTPTPNPDRRGPSQVIHAGAENILVDCGSGVVTRLHETGIRPPEINHLLITHHHSDHYIDLDHFIITRWIFGDDRPLNVYGPPRQKEMIENIMRLHEYDLKIRVAHQGTARPLPEVIVHEFDEGEVLELDGLKVTAFRVEHPPIDYAFGFRFDAKDRGIVLSGDTRPCENLVKHAHGADLLVHECMHAAKMPFIPGSGWESAEQRLEAMALYHTFPEQIGMVARDAAPKLLVTSHMNPISIAEELREIIGRDYSGPLTIGEDLMTL
ncbi:MAG: MBL fold metallo-hydrolase [Rhodospirillales bacterium]|jgi:ribonuclease Z|nr:MBL fold metallo-hydrolase [Rhodospirillaceae bacterium]MDP6427954.1 MBL fold metallo-hydrolase [Rhodospirillales bacterium]MDP6642980.1 MBL fold metallo-hydrolase [Rhodospirillales bacterium]MDP6840734.1 MBL fold metallo-hydrolase [Rhodospirillales bacterium]|tara:strand:+ start:1576 stop:2400 length:825 start_codon:yes stop_codon:yes gene_type:complete